MKTNYLIMAVVMLLAAATARAQVTLRRQGTATQLVVDGRPMLICGGELSNSAASSVEDIDEVMPRMKALGLNTVFVPAYWDLIEPTEGRYDFTLVDRVVEQARENRLHVVLLWFGAWKNSMSCYAPLWFKRDTAKYPRARTAQGKPLEIATAFSENVFEADNRCFGKLMEHLKAVDAEHHTVVMVQVENEIGMLEDARDHSPLAEKHYRQPVPQELVDYLRKNSKTLHPAMTSLLARQDSAARNSGNSRKPDGKVSWASMFGTDAYGDEVFQAYFYARYVERLCQTARKTYDLPLYVNAAMNSRGRKPGEYPSAGPLAHLIDVWHCAAPSVAILAPDLYDAGFKQWVAQYKLWNNPFFTPELQLSANSGVRALYLFGEVDAMSNSPFAIDQAGADAADNLKEAYALVGQLESLLLEKQGRGETWGLLFDQEDQERVIEDDGLVMTCRHFFTLPWDPRARDGSPWPEGGGLIVKLAKNDYLIAGNGVVVTFQTPTEKTQAEQKTLGEDGFVAAGANSQDTKARARRFTGKRVGIGSVDKVRFDERGQMRFVRRYNGDQDHQGRHARISCGDYEILRVQLYEYE